MNGYQRRALAVATALSVAALGTSCTGGSHDLSRVRESDSHSSSGPTGPAPDATSPAPSATPSPETSVRGDDTTPDLSLDAAAKADALSTAVAAWRAFARPDLDFGTWWAGLEPMLTQRAAQGYYYTDPANVVALTVSDTAQIVDAPSGYEVHVEVTTDRGPRTVVLLRGGEDQPWQVDKFVLPEGEH